MPFDNTQELLFMEMDMRASFILLLLIITQTAWSACDDNLPATGARDDVLVLINDNARDSCDIANDYAQKRQLGKTNVLHIKAPANYYIGWNDFQIIRDQIILFLGQKITAEKGITINCTNSETPYYCTNAVQTIIDNSRYKFIVTTMGLPTLIVGVPLPTTRPPINADYEPASFDGYLVAALSSYPSNSSILNSKFSIGRLDGLTVDAAKKLTTRAIDAEKNGVFGSFVGVAGGGTRWSPQSYKPYALFSGMKSENLLSNGSNAWRYFFGLWGETNLNCTGNSTSPFYLNYSQGQGSGAAPTTCKAQFVLGNDDKYIEKVPGITSSRVATPSNVSVFMANMDGQATYEGSPFSTIFNWKKQGANSATLCNPNDQACLNASEDALKEIDTRAIGVSNGFIGFHMRSYPLTYMASWPTGWQPRSSSETTDPSFYPTAWLALPQLDNTDGKDDSHSLVFSSHEASLNSQCYTDTQLNNSTLTTCAEKEKLVIHLSQPISYPADYSISTTSPHITVTLWYKSKAGVNNPAQPNLMKSSLTAVVATGSQKLNKQVRLGTATFNNGALLVGSDQSTWASATASVDLSNAINDATKFDVVNGKVKLQNLLLSLESDSFSGEFKIDSITAVNNDGSSIGLQNASFANGSNQFGTGDWAATFTSRLNGTAFWGSVTHNCGGTAFSSLAADSVVNFLKGSALGKAVWGSENCSGGVLIGDPLYSPINVNIRPNVGSLSEAALKLGQLPLIIDAINGTDNTKVSTQYHVDVCHATTTNPLADFYVCDRVPGSWIATNITGSSNVSNMHATLDASQYSDTVHTLRLSVTTTRLSDNETQTYNSFFTFFGIGKFLTAEGVYDTDSDGLSDEFELFTAHSDPANPDSDGDGLTDGEEVNIYKTNPTIKDTDGDGLSDFDEIKTYNTDPTLIDTDNDGHSDGQEIKDGTLPRDKTSFKPHQIPEPLWRLMVE